MSGRTSFGTGWMVALLSLSLAGCLDDKPEARDASASPTSPPQSVTNQPPRISGTPVTAARTNSPYVFQPDAGDPDGDALSFSIENKPAWATFDVKTGKLSGTPSSASTGTFSGVRIVASDGKAQAALDPFDITVTSPQTTGSATLSWQAPTQKTDGSPLVDLAGYLIRYGTRADALDHEIRLDNPGLTSSVIEGLAPSTWYFSVMAYTSSGALSASSNLVSKTIG